MSNEEIKMIMGDDGIFREYNDEFDITIHCESKAESDKVKEQLEHINDCVPKAVIEDAIDRIKGTTIPNDFEDEYLRAAYAEGMYDAIVILQKCLKEAADDHQEGEL